MTIDAVVSRTSRAIRGVDEEGFHHILKPYKSDDELRRVVAEWVGIRLLAAIGFTVPAVRLARFAIPDLSHTDSLSVAIRERCGSESLALAMAFPGNPNKHCIHDLIPDTMGHKVLNSSEFSGMLLADLWIGNTGARRAIFINSNHLDRESLSPGSERLGGKGLIGIFIANGDVFGGKNWDFQGEQERGIYPRDWSETGREDALNSCAERIASLSAGTILSVIHSVPKVWQTPAMICSLEHVYDDLLSRKEMLSLFIAKLTRKPIGRQLQKSQNKSDFGIING